MGIEHAGMVEGVDRDRDQSQPEVRASLKQVEMDMEDKYHLEKLEVGP